MYIPCVNCTQPKLILMLTTTTTTTLIEHDLHFLNRSHTEVLLFAIGGTLPSIQYKKILLLVVRYVAVQADDVCLSDRDSRFCLSFSVSGCLSVGLFVCLFVYVPICLDCLSFSPLVCPSVGLSCLIFELQDRQSARLRKKGL